MVSKALEFLIIAKNLAGNGVSQAKKSFEGLKNYALSIGASLAGVFAVGRLLAFGKEAMQMASSVKHAADATGLLSDNFQAFAQLAMDSGVAEITEPLAKIRQLMESFDSNPTAAAAIKAIGIQADELKRMKPDDVLLRLAQQMKETGNASSAFAIFGERTTKLIGPLTQLAEGWDKVREKTSLQIIPEKDLVALEEFDTLLGRVGTSLKVLAARVVSARVRADKAFLDVLKHGVNPELDQAALKAEVDAEIAAKKKAAELERDTAKRIHAEQIADRLKKEQEAADKSREIMGGGQYERAKAEAGTDTYKQAAAARVELERLRDAMTSGTLSAEQGNAYALREYAILQDIAKINLERRKQDEEYDARQKASLEEKLKLESDRRKEAEARVKAELNGQAVATAEARISRMEQARDKIDPQALKERRQRLVDEFNQTPDEKKAEREKEREAARQQHKLDVAIKEAERKQRDFGSGLGGKLSEKAKTALQIGNLNVQIPRSEQLLDSIDKQIAAQKEMLQQLLTMK